MGCDDSLSPGLINLRVLGLGEKNWTILIMRNGIAISVK